MSQQIIQRNGSTRGALQYVARSPEPLYCYATAPTDGQSESNARFEEHLVPIEDVRASATGLSLDVDGATLLSQASALSSFDDESEIRERYYAEAADLMRSVTGAQRVVVFDHNIRRGGASATPNGARRPVFHAHADFTAQSALRRATEVLGPAAHSARRLIALNLWRPLAEPVRDSPLAICSSASVATDDLVPAELRYQDRRGEIYYLAHNPSHRWLYAPEMRTSEFWLFKNSDSSEAHPAGVTPHSAFLDADAPSSSPPRQSLEVRAFALFE